MTGKNKWGIYKCLMTTSTTEKWLSLSLSKIDYNEIDFKSSIQEMEIEASIASEAALHN